MSYNKKKHKKNKKLQIHWGRNFGILAVLVCLCGIITYFSLNIYKNGRAYSTPSLAETVGYDVDQDGNYKVSDEQKHLLTFLVEEKAARGIYLYFAAPVEADEAVTARFFFEGNEVKTIETCVPAAQAYLPLICGNQPVDTIQVSIDGSFSLASVVSEYLYVSEENRNSVLIQVIAAIVVVLLFAGAWVAGMERTEKIVGGVVSHIGHVRESVGKDWKAAACLVGCIVGSILCGNVIWFLCMKLFPPHHWQFGRNHLLFGTMIGLILAVITLYLRNRNIRFETMYLCCGLLMSAVLGTLLPFHLNLAWDDQIHYNTEICLSHGRNIASVSEYDYYQSCFYPLLKQYGQGDASQMRELLNDKEANQTATETELGVSFSPSKLVYIPVAFLLFLCRGLGLPTSVYLILGRMAGAWFFFLIMYLGMRHLKSGKMVMAAASFVPVCLYVNSNFHYDYWLLSLTGFSMAYLIGEYQRPGTPLRLRDLMLIYVPFFVGIIAKPVYFPLLGLAAFLPKGKFQSDRFRKVYRLFFVGVIICIAVGFAFYIFGGGIGGGDIRGGAEVNASAQIQFILANPVLYMKTIFGFLKEYLSLEKILFNLVDTAYIPVKTWLGLPTFVWLLFVCVIDRDKENKQIAWYVKAAVFPLVFLSAWIVATAMYVVFTAVGAGTVAGCSGRYLLPLLFPFLLCLSRIRFFVIPQTEKTKRWTEAAVMGCSVIPAMIMMTMFV